MTSITFDTGHQPEAVLRALRDHSVDRNVRITFDTSHQPEAVLRALRDHSPDREVVNAATAELEDRSAPRFAGPVLVVLDEHTHPYAFHSIPVRLGEKVIARTAHGDAVGTVVAWGTGTWDPRKHGPLKRVIAVCR